jgi:hypothetical protein
VRATLAPGVAVTMSPAPQSLAGREVASGDALEMSGPFTVQVNDYVPTWAQRFGLVGSDVIEGAVTLAVLLLLLRVVRSLRHGDPFHRANARRLGAIAFLVGVVGQLAAILRAWGEGLVLGNTTVAPYVRHSVDVSWLPFAAGLGLALLAEVFRRGSVLREDVAGLV